MFKKIKSIFSTWAEVADTKSSVAAAKATLNSDKILKMALEISDDINKIRKAKVETEKAINDAKSRAEEHQQRVNQLEDNIRAAKAKGIDIPDTQYMIALQSKQLHDAYVAKAEELQGGINEYDVAVEKLVETLQDLRLQRDLISLNEESVSMGIDIKGIDSFYKNRTIDVDTLLEKVGTLNGNITGSTTKFDVELYKSKFE